MPAPDPVSVDPSAALGRLRPADAMMIDVVGGPDESNVSRGTAMVALGHGRSHGRVTLPEPILKEAGLEPGDVVAVRTIASGPVEIKALPRLPLAEALERFKADGPVDEEALRNAWQDDAVKDVIGERRRHSGRAA